MASLSTALLVTTFLAGCLASALPPGLHVGIPVPERDSASFSVKQVRNPHHQGRNGPLALEKVYRKYGVAMPDDLAAVVAQTRQRRRRDTGSEATAPVESGAEWLTPVSIGSPAQALQLDIDSGSSDLWVKSSQVPADEVEGQTVYDPSKSNTSQELANATWSITYGDGSSSSGNVYTDHVTIGGVTVKNQSVETAQTLSQSLSEDPSSGLLGLAFSGLNTVKPQKQQTWFDNARSSLDSPLWTVDLRHNASGTYNFGFIDDSAYTGNLTYIAVNSTGGYWNFTTSGFGVGSAFNATPITGIADTGTTLLLLPRDVVSAYYAGVSGAAYSSSQAGYTFPCDADLPGFVLGIGAARIEIPGAYANYTSVGGGACFGGIQRNSGVPFSIFGDVALKAAFVVFQVDGEPRIGWAAKKL